MSLTLTPRYGDHQFKAAQAYFTTVIRDLLDETGPLTPTHYMITEHAGRSTPVRVWEDPTRAHVSMEDHMHLLARVEEAVQGACVSDGSLPAMARAIASIPHHLSSSALHTFVLERVEPADAFTAREHADLIIGVVDELLVFIRSADLTLVQLDDGLYGCAVRGHGSYLIEVSDAETADTGHVHDERRESF